MTFTAFQQKLASSAEHKRYCSADEETGDRWYGILLVRRMEVEEMDVSPDGHWPDGRLGL